MARGLNKVIAIGNLGADPELKYIPSGAAVVNFSIAASEQWKDKSTGQPQERTEWIRCEAWGKLAEVISQYLQKGSQLYLEGKMVTDRFEKDGQTHFSTKVRIDNVLFLGGGSGQPQSRPAQQPSQPAQEDFDDDIPF